MPGEAGIVRTAVDGQRFVARVVEHAQIDAAGVVGIGHHCQQHAAEGYAGLGHVGILILVPPQADQFPFQGIDIDSGWIVLTRAGSRSQQERCDCYHCKNRLFHILEFI